MSYEDQGPRAAGDCRPCSPSVRNRYFRGKLLTVADYEAEQHYLIQRRRLVNRVVLGWGVISGFTVEASDGGFAIGAGVAFDRRGRELVACEGVVLRAAEDLFWLKPGADFGHHPGADPKVGSYLLAAHYAERWVDGVRIDDGCGDASCEWNHVCETVVFSLLPIEACPCGRAGCHAPRYPKSDCDAPVPYDGDSPADVTAGPVHVVDPNDRGPHGTLCAWSHEWLDRGDLDPCKLPPLCVANGIRLDPAAGVPLACVTVSDDGCGGLTFAQVDDDCGPRRLVRPNDILFDLIRGCDLTRIQDLGWSEWHGLVGQRIRRSAFRMMFVAPPPPPASSAPISDSGQDDDDEDPDKTRQPRRENDAVDTHFWVCFSGPVQIASLTPDVITMTLVRRDDDEDLGKVLRVPIPRLRVNKTTEGDPDGTTRRFRPMVSRRFWDGEIKPGSATGFDRLNVVEIRIHGDAILDWAGQAIDANAIARRLPSGNGTPGGDFLSRFVVDPKGERIEPRPSAAVDPMRHPATAA